MTAPQHWTATMNNLTFKDIEGTRHEALQSPRAEDLALQGFSVSAIEQAVCVLCGNIDGDALPRPFDHANRSAVKSGRYIVSAGGRNYDAGHICGICMTPTEGRDDG